MNRVVLTAALMLGCSSLLAQTPVPGKPPAKAGKKSDPGLPVAEGEQLAAAAMTHFGGYECEFKQTVQVVMNPRYDGYVDVRYGKQTYTMRPVLSSTGALRLEDVRGQTLMLQIAYKSMLMDVKAGRRIVDECVHEKQLQAKHDADGQPQTTLLGSETTAATSTTH